MINYPITFRGRAESLPGIKQNWTVQSEDFQAECSVPREFEGLGGTFTPEDFFLMAITNCFLATFKVFSEYSKLNFDKLIVESSLIVDKNEDQMVTMKSAHLNITLVNVSDQKKANLLVKKTIETGFILKSVKTDITYNVQLS
jgi:organic hydroperoxide reductase OsmC/OhrA